MRGSSSCSGVAIGEVWWTVARSNLASAARDAQHDARRMFLARHPRAAALAIGSASVLTAAFILRRRRQLSASAIDWWRISAVEVVEALKAGHTTPSAVLESAIARMQAVEPETNAVVIPCLERARKRARELEALPSLPPPLFGLPILVKDNQPVRGEIWTEGSKIHADRVAAASHPVVEQIEASGGVVFVRRTFFLLPFHALTAARAPRRA